MKLRMQNTPLRSHSIWLHC